MMAANFIANFIVISMKSTNMPVSIVPKTKRFKVLCVCIANYGVNNEKSEIHGLPGVLKMLTMEKRQKSNILCMISKNSDFGVGGNVKFFTEANFIPINTKFTNLNQKIIF